MVFGGCVHTAFYQSRCLFALLYVCMCVLRPGTGSRKKTTFVALRVTRAGILVSKGCLLGIGRCEVSWCLPSPVK